MEFAITKIISAFLLPPLNCFLLALFGLLFLKKRPRLGKGIIITSFILLYCLTIPWIAYHLSSTLPSYPPITPIHKDVGAIVILGAGIYAQAPEYGEDTVSGAALDRIRYGAKLYRDTGKPILVAGGRPAKTKFSEAEAMRNVLVKEFKVPVRWLEEQSKTTFENAKYSYEILSREGINKIYLVTNAWHMFRSKSIFESFGFEVIPAPTIISSSSISLSILSFLPQAGALSKNSQVFHEWIGQLWYGLKKSI